MEVLAELARLLEVAKYDGVPPAAPEMNVHIEMAGLAQGTSTEIPPCTPPSPGSPSKETSHKPRVKESKACMEFLGLKSIGPGPGEREAHAHMEPWKTSPPPPYTKESTRRGGQKPYGLQRGVGGGKLCRGTAKYIWGARQKKNNQITIS